MILLFCVYNRLCISKFVSLFFRFPVGAFKIGCKITHFSDNVQVVLSLFLPNCCKFNVLL